MKSNACKFSSSGDIIVTARATLIPANEPENYPKFEITFSVKDQGIGITEEAKSRILTPFMQADISIARKFVSFLRYFNEISGRDWPRTCYLQASGRIDGRKALV